MTLVTPQHWEVWMGDKPMPEECTLEQMWAMIDVIQDMDNRDYAIEQITWYEDLWRKTLPKYKLAEEHKDVDEDNLKRYETLSATMKLIKEGIEFWRRELSE
jgi:hypothetical protein